MGLFVESPWRTVDKGLGKINIVKAPLSLAVETVEKDQMTPNPVT